MSDDDTLCCCEYRNRNNERSHLMATCCDCEALDQMADRFFKCEKIPPSLFNKFVDTALDRCRIPGFTGGGATKINFEVATPIVVIPLSLTLCATGPVTSLVILSLLPYFCYFFYRTWKRKTNKKRTKFFFVWGLTSLFFMYFLFEMIVCINADISLFNNLIVTISVISMCAALTLAKKDPGIVPRDKLGQYMNESLDVFGMSDTVTKTHDEDILDFEVIEHGDVQPSDKDERAEDFAVGDQKSRGDNWCESCCVEKPLRSGHCTVCDVCIHVRDHHCVWIDSCVGAQNHRSFLVAMTIFIFTSYYGSYLTLTAVCDPSWSHEITCSYHTAYRDFKWGLCYASAWYVIVVATIMSVGWIHQVILVSQNLTSQELHSAVKFGTASFLLFNTSNIYNRGVIQNWQDFCNKQRYVGTYRTV